MYVCWPCPGRRFRIGWQAARAPLSLYVHWALNAQQPCDGGGSGMHEWLWTVVHTIPDHHLVTGRATLDVGPNVMPEWQKENLRGSQPTVHTPCLQLFKWLHYVAFDASHCVRECLWVCGGMGWLHATYTNGQNQGGPWVCVCVSLVSFHIGFCNVWCFMIDPLLLINCINMDFGLLSSLYGPWSACFYLVASSLPCCMHHEVFSSPDSPFFGWPLVNFCLFYDFSLFCPTYRRGSMRRFQNGIYFKSPPPKRRTRKNLILKSLKVT